jgi:phenylpropionate dioxygenase-like ring-hydroxylating dioxygenase large terminal subunit
MLFITLVVTELLVWSVVNVILLFCPYHKWGYGLDGDLRGGPQREQLDNLNLKELGLHKASVESWMGLLFVHADEQPGLSFAQWSIGLADKLAAFEVDQLLLLKQESFTFESKWKLYIKNHADWPHLGYVHRETLGRLEHSEEKIM